MGIINVLDRHVADLIAAGEVVERPASAVKELVENSIDAGADNITVEIKHGGISYMRITDNGKGMSPDDARLCLRRHATSKIKNATDLDGILTLGFRGEALAAISSVSKMRIMTKQKGEMSGTLLVSDGGEITEVRETGCPEGTTVIVEELFYNVPARRKFLKKDSSEAMGISSIVEKIAIAEPDISIKLIIDGLVKFSTTGNGKLYDVIYQIYGRDFSKKLIPVDNLTDNIEVTGFIGNPDNTRANRNFQNFYINDRYVKSKTVIAAFEQAYESFIPQDKFPCCVLKINIHPSFVDVNVHPTKLEVKFSNEQSVFDSVYCAVKNTLTQSIKRPELDLGYSQPQLSSDYLHTAEPYLIKQPPKEESKKSVSEQIDATRKYSESSPDYFNPAFAPIGKVLSPDELTSDKADKSSDGGAHQQDFEIVIPKTHTPLENTSAVSVKQQAEIKAESSSPKSAYNLTENIQNKAVEPEKNVPDLQRNTEKIPDYKIIGEAFDCYVFLEIDNKVLIIDKHAAHERIIFEELKRNMMSGIECSQILLLPLEINLCAEEIAAIDEYKTEINQTGFDFASNDGCVTLTRIPAEIPREKAADVFTEIAGKLSSGESGPALTKKLLYEKALYSASCKAAIKGGIVYNQAHIKWICDTILTYPDIKFCPHGRPIAFELEKKDFDSKFNRI